MYKEIFQYVLNNLRTRVLRSLLTVGSIAIAVTTVVVLISLSLGLYVGFNDQFDALGGNTIFIQPRSPVPTAESGDLTLRDANLIDGLPGVDNAYGILFSSVQVQSRSDVRYVYAAGIPIDRNQEFVQDAFLLEVYDGRHLRSGDSNSVVLGYRYTLDNTVFPRGLNLRDRIFINDQRFDIVGFYEELGNPVDDMNVYMTESALRNLLNDPDGVSVIIARASPGQDLEVVTDSITRRLRRSLGESAGQESFFVQTAEDLRQTFNTILSILIVFIVAIGLISLIVGAINIMNTMYTAVLERTQEIGILKAIGGRNGDILMMFIAESAVIGFLGGVVGTAIAFVLAYGITLFAAAAGFAVLQFYFPLWLILTGIGFAMLMGIVSGYFPALQASSQKPVDALRYE